jgi:cell division protein FtsB
MIKAIGFNSIIIILLIYFAYHTFSGDRGLIALLQLNTEIYNQQSELDRLSAERAELEKKVSMLRPHSVDIDLLEEIVKRELALAHREEKVITEITDEPRDTNNKK